MIAFLFYLVIFGFIYSLSNRVTALQQELFLLKKKSTTQRVRAKGSVSFKATEAPVKEATPDIVQKYETIETVKAQAPSEPTNAWFDYIKNYFTTGNVAVRIGGVILFFGLAFLAKYASDNSMVSIEIRMLALVFFSFALITVGWRLREREGYYGLILQGIGIGVFYLVVYVSTKSYLLLSPATAFIIMLSIVIFGSLLAVRQNSLHLAVFAIGGGFLAPILTSDGSGSHIGLFTYFALLNSAIVGIAWYRSWRFLNLLGFVFTFGIATTWGVLDYDSTLFMTTEPFLILFFFFYLSVSILFSYKQDFDAKGIIDGTLVFGLPFIVFTLQTSLASQLENTLAISAIAMGSIYFVLFKILSRNKDMQLLSLSFLSLSIIFFTLAIPYIFNARITSALWVLEAAAIIWVSLRQEHFFARVFAQGLLLFSTLIYIVESFNNQTPSLAFINNIYLGYFIIFTANFFSAYMLYKHENQLREADKQAPLLFLVIALVLWFFSGVQEAERINISFTNTMLIYTALGGFLLAFTASKLKWKPLINILQGYLVIGGLLLVSLVSHYSFTHPFAGFGALSIPLFFAVHYFQLHLFDKEWELQRPLHLVSLWILTLIMSKEFSYLVSLITTSETFIISSWGVSFIAILVLIRKKERLLPKTFDAYLEDYRLLGAMGIIMMLVCWEVLSLFLSGNPAPLPYLPLLNPLELVEITGLFLMYDYFKKRTKVFAFLGGAALLLSTIILARTIHVYVDIDYSFFKLTESIIFQMSLSILWSIIAVFIMIKANSLQNRTLWIWGAGLIGVVVVKLFLIELANSGSVERIISFIAVGLLLLLVGYFAPLPTLKEKSIQEAP